ncbi:MAG: GNAT family N-acetyltransferase [Acidimicrobiia bacterium]
MDSSPLPETVEIELKSGIKAEVRPILPIDAPLIAEGLSGLSESSRFARFGVGIHSLSSRELRYLSEVDHRTHVAWGAAIGGEPAGVGRYFVLPEEGCAEVALTVVDKFQRQGLGRSLFDVLTAVARHDGVPTFCFEVASSNEPVKRLLRGLTGQETSSGLLHGRAHVADLPVTPYEDELMALLEKYRADTVKDT